MAISLFDLAQESISKTGFSSLGTSMEGLTVDVNDANVIESRVNADFATYLEYSQECYDELNRHNMEFAVIEGVAAIRFMEATDEYQRSLVTEGLRDKLEDAWEYIKEFLAKAWEAIKKYAKKFLDMLKKRYEVAKGMLTKYNKVLVGKAVDDSIVFNWATIDIDGYTKKRSEWLGKAFNPFQAGLIGIVKRAEATLTAYNNADQNALEAEIAKWKADWGESTIMSTNTLANEMDTTLYGSGKHGPAYDQKKWSEIGSEAIKYADTKFDTLVSEALGLYEKDTGSLNKIIDGGKKLAIQAAKNTKANSFISAVKALVSTYASGLKKVNDMYIHRLQTAIGHLQTQAISACRKAITAKGTKNVNEASFLGIDSIII